MVSNEGIQSEAILSADSPSLAINLAAEEVEADLIVMGTRGLSGLKHAVLGSVAERVVRLAPCPVLTVKHPEAD
jgi:nucleotide-binding universal stress UspA family protein